VAGTFLWIITSVVRPKTDFLPIVEPGPP
jgi:hypothetical protein